MLSIKSTKSFSVILTVFFATGFDMSLSFWKSYYY